MENLTDSQIKCAINLYEKHKQSCKRWQQKNREKMNEHAKTYYKKIKEDPEKYEKYLEKCRKRYVPVKDRPVNPVEPPTI